MKKLLGIVTCCVLLTACTTPAIVAFPVVAGAGLAINNENLDEPLTNPKEIGEAIVEGVKAGYSQEENTSFALNE